MPESERESLADLDLKVRFSYQFEQDFNETDPDSLHDMVI